MKLLLNALVALFVFCPVAQAQLSRFQPARVEIPDPAYAPMTSSEWAALHWLPAGGIWQHPQAGIWHIQNALVDADNKIGPWSQPKVMNLPLGWFLVVNDANLPKHKDRAAVVWRAIRQSTGQAVWLTETFRQGDMGAWGLSGTTFEQNLPYPWSTNNPLPYTLTIHDRGNAFVPIESSTILAGAGSPSAPNVWVCGHKLEQQEVAWSWVTHSGESRLSPSLVIPANPQHSGVGGYRRILIAHFVGSWPPRLECDPIPPGALGRYVYLKINGVWRRQIAAPWLATDGNPDKYLFAVHDQQPILWDCTNGPVHVPPAAGQRAWSIISALQQLLLTEEAAIIVDSKVAEAYSPLIDPYKLAVKNRVVTGVVGSGWTIKQVDPPAVPGYNPPNNHPTYWPLVVCQNAPLQKTTWKSMFFEAGTRAPGASMCITSCDYSGGQAFETRLEDCHISISGTQALPYPKEGMVVDWASTTHPGSHTSSEWKITRCATMSLRQQGTQTVNSIWRDATFLGAPCGHCVIDGGEAVFDGLIVASANNLFSLGWGSSVKVTGLFVDKPCNSLVDFNTPQPRRVTIRDSNTSGFHFLSRSPTTIAGQKVILTGWHGYRRSLPPNAEAGLLYHCSYNRIDRDIRDSEVLQPYISIRQPTMLDFSSRVPATVPVTNTTTISP